MRPLDLDALGWCHSIHCVGRGRIAWRRSCLRAAPIRIDHGSPPRNAALYLDYSLSGAKRYSSQREPSAFCPFLPRELFRRWWLWAAVVMAVTTLEGLGKDIINRPRPEAMRPGFPSNHVAVAAAVYLMAAYFAASNVNRRWFKYAAYGIASFLVLMVALSRNRVCDSIGLLTFLVERRWASPRWLRPSGGTKRIR